jgi:carboxypeptidase C (cathepsin A)
VDLNGLINLSQINLWSYFPDMESLNPGVDETYVLDLPTYAATAWYHHALPSQPADLGAFLEQVERFADGDYLLALQAGSALDPGRKTEIAHRLHDFTGLPESLILKADLRIPAGVFEKHLHAERDLTVGRLDARFAGPSVDPLGKDAEYDPQSAAISSAYVAAFNAYARSELHVGAEQEFKPEIDIEANWNYAHQPPGAPSAISMTPNVMVDLANAMKHNPLLKVMFNGGYYDLATPFYATVYERNHLAIPASLRDNIELNFYESGHMVYANEPSHKQLHERVANFIQRASRPAND